MRHNRRDLSRKLRADAKIFLANCNHCCAGQTLPESWIHRSSFAWVRQTRRPARLIMPSGPRIATRTDAAADTGNEIYTIKKIVKW
jgi:hypothetical protein